MLINMIEGLSEIGHTQRSNAAMDDNKPETIDQYSGAFPPNEQERLLRIRQDIQ